MTFADELRAAVGRFHDETITLTMTDGTVSAVSVDRLVNAVELIADRMQSERGVHPGQGQIPVPQHVLRAAS